MYKRWIAVGKNQDNHWASRHVAASFLLWQPMLRSLPMPLVALLTSLQSACYASASPVCATANSARCRTSIPPGVAFG